MNSLNQELDRIKAEYERRDALNLSRDYTYSNPAFAYHMEERERAILKLIHSEKIDLSSARILEVGCGTGGVLRKFSESGVRFAVGIDIMPTRIQAAKQNYSHLCLAQANAAQLPFQSRQFDMVMQFMCLSSVLDPVMRSKIAEEMWRVLKPSGYILYYDLRPRPILGKWFFKSVAGALKILKILGIRKERIRDKNAPQNTPIYLIKKNEIRMLFPHGDMRIRSASLDFKLAGMVTGSYWFVRVLSMLPFLRTHYLVMIRKNECDK